MQGVSYWPELCFLLTVFVGWYDFFYFFHTFRHESSFASFHNVQKCVVEFFFLLEIDRSTKGPIKIPCFSKLQWPKKSHKMINMLHYITSYRYRYCTTYVWKVTKLGTVNKTGKQYHTTVHFNSVSKPPLFWAAPGKKGRLRLQKLKFVIFVSSKG